MFPILFENTYIIVPSWHIFFILSVLCTFSCYAFLNKQLKPPFSGKQLKTILLFVYICSYVGARLLSVFIEEDPLSLFDALYKTTQAGSLYFNGGLACSFISLVIYLTLTKQSFFQHLDIGVPSCLLGLSIIRIGCFLNGDDYGFPVIYHNTPPWWAVTFPNHLHPIPRYPTQLFESVSTLTIFLLFFFNFKTLRQRLPLGCTGLLGIILYEMIRFFNDYYRDDPKTWLIHNQLSATQGVNLFLILMALFFYKKNTEFSSKSYYS